MKKNALPEYKRQFNRRYRLKKLVNLAISATIVLLGVTSFLFGLRLEPSVTIFRFMTVDGTVFTTVGAAIFLFVNAVEIVRNTEMTWVWVYYARLSTAVAESVILIVVLFSQLPIFSEHLMIFGQYDFVAMHLLIPILRIASFLLNDSPIGKLKPMERWHGTWFVTFYGVVIMTLIGTGQLPSGLIPYFFLDYQKNGVGIVLLAFVFVYASAYLMSWKLSDWNCRLSWIWFKGISPSRPSAS